MTKREGFEVGYDASGKVQIIEGVTPDAADQAELQATALDGGCTAGAATMEAAARDAGVLRAAGSLGRGAPGEFPGVGGSH